MVASNILFSFGSYFVRVSLSVEENTPRVKSGKNDGVITNLISDVGAASWKKPAELANEEFSRGCLLVKTCRSSRLKENQKCKHYRSID